MKVASLWMILLLVLASIAFAPLVAAQNDDEENADDSSCILTSFCIVIFILLFLFYLSVKKKSKEQNEVPTGTVSRFPRPPQGYRYPPPGTGSQPYGTTRPQTQPVAHVEVKCDLCSSKNLRTFEDGYFKCNECRHVFYISESGRRR